MEAGPAGHIYQQYQLYLKLGLPDYEDTREKYVRSRSKRKEKYSYPENLHMQIVKEEPTKILNFKEGCKGPH